MPVKLILTKRFEDDRGWFSETFHEARYSEMGIDCHFVQDNQSYSSKAGTLRGLHFQTPPYAQAKLVRCIRGAIYDVAVDLRADSPTYGEWVGAELSAENGKQLFIPVGFGHGFLTLEDNAEVVYKVSSRYAASSEGGVIWDDEDMNIAWPISDGHGPYLSAKDQRLPKLRDLKSPFTYDGQPLQKLFA